MFSSAAILLISQVPLVQVVQSIHGLRSPVPVTNPQSDYIAAAQREPTEITSRGAGRRAVVVSPEFYDRALQALEDQANVRAAADARRKPRILFEDLMEELGL